MTLRSPELLLLLLLAPAFALAAAALWRRRLAAMARWADRHLWRRLGLVHEPYRIALRVALPALAVAGLALALAQPRWGEHREEVERRGVDVVIVLDASLSMGARDLTPSRMEVAKALLRRLIQDLPGHRLALVGAQGDGVVMAPLTTDAAVMDLLLDGLHAGSLPVQGTDLARSVELGFELFPPGTEKHRVILLVSDGEDHGGGLTALAPRLAEAGVVVHSLGIGTLEGATVPVPGAPGAVKRHEDGNLVISRLEEGGLEEVTRATGGVYLRAIDSARSLTPVLAALNRMELRELTSDTVDTRAERFQWPLALAAFGLLLGLAVAPFGTPPASAEARPPSGEAKVREATP